MITKTIDLTFIVVAVTAIVLMTTPATGQVEITRSTITCGGGTATSATYAINGSLGIAVATVGESATYEVTGGIHFGTGVPGTPCVAVVDCRNDPANNACNAVTCTGTCTYACRKFGDITPATCPNMGCGVVNLDDILCLLTGFGNFASCPNGDLRPCGGNGIINLDDILDALAAFGGDNPCGCSSTAATPLCGSISP
jgi:hypothetical protein